MPESAQRTSASVLAKRLSLVLGTVVAGALIATSVPVRAQDSGSQASENPDAANQLLADAAFGHPTRMPSPIPETVTSIAPQHGASGVATDTPLTVTYSAPVTASAPTTPAVSPAIEGTWTRHGTQMTFVPSRGWQPYTTYTVTVPSGAAADFTQHAPGPTAATITTFTAQPASRARVEQFLAELNYLPFTLQSPSGQSGLDTEATTASAVRVAPQPGTLAWSWSNVPPTLRALWSPGQPNVMDRGAVMAFEADHQLPMDGNVGPRVWNALVAAVAARQAASHPYYYLVASKSLPESLTVYRDGQVVATSPANTGVPGAVTESGTFPVYQRYASQTMSGTNPDGTKYVDPGVPWVAYFNGGDAVHGYARSSYGHPQSNGCVELPVDTAAQIWQMDPYGTLVTVTG